MSHETAFPQVTVAVPLYNESARFPGLLHAILNQTYPQDSLQVLLIDGGSSDGTQVLAEQAAAQYRHITYLTNPKRCAAAALNLALVQARGVFFLRLDARARPAPDYIACCIRRLQDGPWAGVAGPQWAVGETRAGRVHALALNHPFGAGAPRYRRAQTPQESETLYLGAYPTAWLRRVGGWDERFGANEDFDLNSRLRRAGGRLLVDPAIRSSYVARDSLPALWRQYARYGAWRTITWRRHPDALRLRHLIPALFVAGMFLALLLAPVTLLPLLALLLLYLTLDLSVSLYLALRHDLRGFLRLFATFPTIHLAWGSAFWLAWLRPPRRDDEGPC